MSLIQLTSATRPFGFDSASLAGILVAARRCNARDGITGALICRNDLYLQLLEGPSDEVESAYRRIRRDDRHVEVRLLTRHVVADDARLFGRWAMHDDPAASWIWTRDQVDDGAVERASVDEVMAVFNRLSGELAAA